MDAGRMPAWIVGLVAAVVIAVGSYLAYTKELPWADAEEVSAVFASSQGLRADSPVRVAGVNVGKVSEVRHLDTDDPDAGVVVTMELTEDAPDLHSDAQFKLRPRLFLEGNYFVDVHTGSPSAPVVEEGHSFPLNQTANSAQIDQLFTTFQADVRSNLQITLDQFGNALMRYGGADGWREIHRSSPRAYRYTAEVNEAFLGREPHDLSGTIRGLGRVVSGLGRDERALQEFVTNLRVTTGSFAAQDRALGRAIELLPGFLEAGEPAFTELNGSLPALRAFAREILPGVRSAPETLRVATPWLRQMSGLMSRPELRGLARDLRPTIPLLARLNRRNLGFLRQQRALSSCFNEVVIPWSNDTVEPVDPTGVYRHEPQGRVFEESAWAITGTASESRSGDGNGQHLRVMGGSGPNMVRLPGLATSVIQDGAPQPLFGLTAYPLLGAMPELSDSEKTRFRPNVRCETQEQPSLQAGLGPAPGEPGSPPGSDQFPVPTSTSSAMSGPEAERLQALDAKLEELEQVPELREQGEEDLAQDLIRRGERVFERLGLSGLDLEGLLAAGPSLGGGGE